MNFVQRKGFYLREFRLIVEDNVFMKMSKKQIQAYRFVSGEFEGKSTAEAAIEMSITPQAINRLLKRAEKICPSMFPLLTKQEADARAWLVIGHNNYDLASQLGVSLSRVSQIVNSLYNKRPNMLTPSQPIKMIRYEPHLDSQIRMKF